MFFSPIHQACRHPRAAKNPQAMVPTFAKLSSDKWRSAQLYLKPHSMKALKKSNFSRKGFCRNPRGIFPTKTLGEFCGGFSGGLFGAFFLGKNRTKKSTRKSTAKFKSEFGSFGAKIHTARIWAWKFSVDFADYADGCMWCMTEVVHIGVPILGLTIPRQQPTPKGTSPATCQLHLSQLHLQLPHVNFIFQTTSKPNFEETTNVVWRIGLS